MTENTIGSAPELSGMKPDKTNTPRTPFNLSRAHYFNAIHGAIMPIEIWPTLPHEDYDIELDAIVNLRNPLIRKMKNNVRIYTHAFYIRNSDLWEGWNDCISQGQQLDINLEAPKFAPFYNDTEDGFDGKATKGKWFTTLTPMSPLDYMGFPIHFYNMNLPDGTRRNSQYAWKPSYWKNNGTTQSGSGAYTGFYYNGEWDLKINALPLLMYEKVCRKYFYNKNIILNNKNIVTNENNKMKFPYDCSQQNYTNKSGVTAKTDYGTLVNIAPIAGKNSCLIGPKEIDSYRYSTENKCDVDSVPNNTNSISYLNTLHFRQWRGDLYTAGSPFADLLKKAAPTITLAKVSQGINVPTLDPRAGVTDSKNISIGKPTSAQQSGYWIIDSNTPGVEPTGAKQALQRISVETEAQANINLYQLNQLTIQTEILRQLSKINSSEFYNEMIETFYGKNPHAHSGEPEYIGGNYQDMVFSDVVNQNGAGGSSQDVPLGAKAGQGISANSNKIGHFYSPDYGYIMICMEIIPESIYVSKEDRKFTKTLKEEFYLPIENGLAPQATLKREISLPQSPNEDQKEVDEPFNYTNRFDDMKSQQNIVTGFGSLKGMLYDRSQYMLRVFNEIPEFNNAFLTCCPDNTDMSPFTSYEEPPYDITTSLRMRVVSPQPREARPRAL